MKKRIVITRTLPLTEFRVLLKKLEAHYQNWDIILLLQDSVLEEFSSTGKYRCHRLPDGLLKFLAMDKQLIKKIEAIRPHRFMIPSNNPGFQGYDEFIKLAIACRARQIIQVTPKFDIKIVSRTRFRFRKSSDWKTWFKYLILMITAIPLSIILFPYYRVQHKLHD